MESEDKIYTSGGVGLFLSKEETCNMVTRFMKREIPEQQDIKPSLYGIGKIIEVECEGKFLTKEKVKNVKILPLTEEAKKFVDSIKDWEHCSFFHAGTEYALLSNTKDKSESINTICQKFKRYLGKYLPDDFNYPAHIVDFTGMYFDEDTVLRHRKEKDASYEKEVIEKFIDALQAQLLSDEVASGILSMADAGTVIGCAKYMLSENLLTKEDVENS